MTNKIEAKTPRTLLLFTNSGMLSDNVPEVVRLLNDQTGCQYAIKDYGNLEQLRQAMESLPEEQRKETILLAGPFYGGSTASGRNDEDSLTALGVAGRLGIPAVGAFLDEGTRGTASADTILAANPSAGVHIGGYAPEILAEVMIDKIPGAKNKWVVNLETRPTYPHTLSGRR